MKNIFGAIAIVGLSLTLSACGGGSDSNAQEQQETQQKPTAVIDLQTPIDSTFSLEDGAVQVKLNADASTHEQSTSLTYKWELIERPTTSNADISSDDTTATEFTADLPGEYVISLIVNDGTNNSEAARLTLTATSPYPVAITEPIYSVSLGTDSIGLDGSLSVTPSGGTAALEYQWSLIEKPIDSAGYLNNADQSQSTLFVDVAGEYKLQLVVIHDGIASEPADVVVSVSSGNAPPVAKADDITIILGEEAVLDASTSTDPEGEQLQYRWQWLNYKPTTPDNVPLPELKGATTATVSFTPQAVASYKLMLFVFDGTRKSEEKEVTITVEKNPEATKNEAPIGELSATGYFPSYSIGEQEVGLRAEFNFTGYDPEGEALQIIEATLVDKPQGSAAELVDIGSWKPMGKKIQTLDVAGTYLVRMVVSDGENQISLDATMQAKVGNVNGQPSTSGVSAQSKSVLVGDALVFDASSSDPNDDPMTFHWELIDRPDGSSATIEAVIEPESQEYRRAKVITDIPGSYTARLIVEDDRGLFAKSYSQDSGLAKLSNTAPEIRSVVWARNWGRLNPGENYYQILPCMSLLHRPVTVDADGDEVFTHEELISTPQDGEFTSYPSDGACENTRGQVFTKPGTYTFRYSATDLIDDAPQYDFVVKVDPIAEAKGVRLRSLNDEDESLWQPLPYENIPPFANDFYASSKPFLEEGFVRWSITAVDADYTIENLQVRHINGDLESLTPRFENLKDKQVIAKGAAVEFKTILPAVPCIRNEEASEGFHFSFNIKEIPEITFVYETWRTASKSSLFDEWTECEAQE
ncbi:PKD domain-containing protein [Pseudoalteromonas sp. ZZD1]|uniref:PKD domain-containing protein n=1 Tax=Pseudoalteromonas sp. ZZD1 TaxID=3139395 RepID=UPI003BADB5BF